MLLTFKEIFQIRSIFQRKYSENDNKETIAKIWYFLRETDQVENFIIEKFNPIENIFELNEKGLPKIISVNENIAYFKLNEHPKAKEEILVEFDKFIDQICEFNIDDDLSFHRNELKAIFSNEEMDYLKAVIKEEKYAI